MTNNYERANDCYRTCSTQCPAQLLFSKQVAGHSTLRLSNLSYCHPSILLQLVRRKTCCSPHLRRTVSPYAAAQCLSFMMIESVCLKFGTDGKTAEIAQKGQDQLWNTTSAVVGVCSLGSIGADCSVPLLQGEASCTRARALQQLDPRPETT